MHSDFVARHLDSQPFTGLDNGVQHQADLRHDGLLQRHGFVQLPFVWLLVENALDRP